jgi:hypothetical protein
MVLFMLAYVTLVPWIGHVIVRLLTLGKIDLGWRPSDPEAEVSQYIGIAALILVVTVISALIHT